MLELHAVDLEDLAQALDDHSPEHSWHVNRHTGELLFISEFERSDEDAELLDGNDLVRVDPLSSRVGYADMADFIERVPDPRARDLLARSIAGRGAFRRFKNTLHEFEELPRAWYTFRDSRMQRRAVEWLADEDLVERDAADRFADDHSDPYLPELSGGVVPDTIASAVAADLRELYGDRLVRVMLFGPWARGETDEKSGLGLLVVLTGMSSPYEEIRRMARVVLEQGMSHGIAVSALPVTSELLQRQDVPFLVQAVAEARAVR